MILPLLIISVLVLQATTAYTVPIAVQNADELATAVIVMQYEPGAIAITSADSGAMDVLAYNDQDGLLKIAAMNPYGVSGNVTLCTIRMNRLVSHKTTITVSFEQTYRTDYTEQRFESQTITLSPLSSKTSVSKIGKPQRRIAK